MAPVEYQVSGLSGALCTAHLEAKMTVHELKTSVEASTGITVESQRLFHGLSELGDSDRLPNAESTPAVEVHLVRRGPEQLQWFRQIDELARSSSSEDVSSWLRDAPETAQSDVEVVLKAVTKSGSAIHWAAPELRSRREVVLAAVASGLALEHVAPEMQDSEIVLAAVVQQGLEWQIAATDLAVSFAGAVLAAVHHLGKVCWHGEENRDVVLAGVEQNSLALWSASAELKADRELVMAAVTKNGLALEFAAVELKADRGIVMAAVAQNWQALEHTAPELLADREVALTAVAQHESALSLVAREFQADRDLVLDAVSKHGRSLAHAVEELKADRDVVLAAVAQDRRALAYAADIFQAEGRSSLGL